MAKKIWNESEEIKSVINVKKFEKGKGYHFSKSDVLLPGK